MNWLYNNKEVSSIDDFPKDTQGFVYKITHIPTGNYYIGKKSIISIRNVKIGKRELAKIKEERKEKGIGGRPPSKKRVVKESKWADYWSSNDWIKAEIKKGNKKDFKREILQAYPTKKSLTYGEIEEQVKRDVLRDEKSLNGNILSKFFKKDLIDI